MNIYNSRFKKYGQTLIKIGNIDLLLVIFEIITI